MATIFDATGVGPILSMIFVFLFVFAVMFALLKKVKFLEGNEGFNGIIAFVVAMFTVITPGSLTVIGNFLPWFFLFFVLVLIIFMFFMFIGVKGDTIIENVAKQAPFITTAVSAIVILFFLALTKAYGPFLLVDGGIGFWATTKRFIFSRQFLGIIFLLFVGAYAIGFLGDTKNSK